MMSLRHVLAVSNLYSAFSLQILAIRPCCNNIYSGISGRWCPFMLNPFALRYIHSVLLVVSSLKAKNRSEAKVGGWSLATARP